MKNKIKLIKYAEALVIVCGCKGEVLAWVKGSNPNSVPVVPYLSLTVDAISNCLKNPSLIAILVPAGHMLHSASPCFNNMTLYYCLLCNDSQIMWRNISV